MIQRDDVQAFFDRCAPTWDAELVRSEEIIDIILTGAGVCAGSRVLDVACGTGVLIGDYLARGAASVTAIDLSPEMARRAASKFPQPSVRVLCGDVEELDVGHDFDVVMVYNAFPHFPQPARLITRLSSLLAPGGTLTVAHGMSRAVIDRHHLGPARKVSMGLMEAEQLAELFAPYLQVELTISDDRMYQVTGRKL